LPSVTSSSHPDQASSSGIPVMTHRNDFKEGDN
jgi:hypothetical protein